MNILVLGAYDSVNLGDPVICECVAAILQRNFPDAKIIIRDVISRDRHKPISDIGIRELEKRRIKMNICRFSSRYLGIDLTLRTETNRFNAHRRHLEEVFKIPCDLVVFAGGRCLWTDMPCFWKHVFFISRTKEFLLFLMHAVQDQLIAGQ